MNLRQFPHPPHPPPSTHSPYISVTPSPSDSHHLPHPHPLLFSPSPALEAPLEAPRQSYKHSSSRSPSSTPHTPAPCTQKTQPPPTPSRCLIARRVRKREADFASCGFHELGGQQLP
ncbi:hypothetical protein KSP40_PGU004570 [Platanthera guangdongensis]|uniref:Uncharacterized protein n=1 Tax=Platanthera guangdongensis TaxID=2320717 RepID=A0ABR2M9V1_9ASPA